MNQKELFKKFTAANLDQLPFSMHYSWWNEVVKDNWNVSVVANQNQVVAVWPYFFRKRGPWTFISNFYFTPYSGPFIVYPDGQKPDSRISFQNKIHRQLIEQLPPFAELNQNFYLQFTNSLEFLWNDFQDFKRYTYLLDLEHHEDQLWKNLKENCRRQINKGKKTLTIQHCENPEQLERLLKSSYQSKGESYPNFPSSIFDRIYNYIQTYDSGWFWKAVDRDGQLHATILCIYDKQTAYYLIGGSDHKHRSSAAISYLMWESILKAKEVGKTTFNFEGSTIQGVEKFLRGFGGSLIPFSTIHKTSSTSLKLLRNFLSKQ